MAYAIGTPQDDEALRFLISGKFSDFEIRLPDFSFRVHKVVIGAKSRYFEAMCGKFLEGSQGYVQLSDQENPIMIARLLQAMYHGDYGTDHCESMLPAMMRNATSKGKRNAVTYHGEVSTACKMHAILYAMGDFYQVPGLVELAKTKFLTIINEADFTSEDLVSAIDVVYGTTPDNNDGLRKHVVYQAQCKMQDLRGKPSFRAVYEKYVDFAWHFGMEYKHRNALWCTSCESSTKLTPFCHCGFNGLCGKTKACNEVDWDNLKCTSCKRFGTLLRQEPKAEDEAEDEDATITVR